MIHQLTKDRLKDLSWDELEKHYKVVHAYLRVVYSEMKIRNLNDEF